MLSISLWSLLAALTLQTNTSSNAPHNELTNGKLRIKVYLPHAEQGFYRGTRFDWSGVIYSLEAGGHEYYGPWFTKTNRGVHDFIYDGPEDIVAGPSSAITGPVDEFAPVGWDEAKTGGTFVKIGVGALRKPGDAPYDNYHLYEIADGGEWNISLQSNVLTFTQELANTPAGYGYAYQKIIRLEQGKPEMTLEHRLKNTGTKAIETKVYNHNFLVLDHHAPEPGVIITLPFDVQSPKPPNAELATIRGNQILYAKTLEGKDVVAMPIEGFGHSAKDHVIRIENSRAGAGLEITGDRPLLSLSLWSIRSVLAIEPFIAISVQPESEFTWKSTYRYYGLGK